MISCPAARSLLGQRCYIKSQLCTRRWHETDVTGSPSVEPMPSRSQRQFVSAGGFAAVSPRGCGGWDLADENTQARVLALVQPMIDADQTVRLVDPRRQHFERAHGADLD